MHPSGSNRALIGVTFFLLAGCLAATTLMCGGGNLVGYYAFKPPVMLTDTAQIATEMDRIDQTVRTLRQARETAAVPRSFMDKATLRETMLSDFAEDYTPEMARDEQQMYVAFGLMKDTDDLYAMYLNLLTDGVAGYFDDETREIVLISDAGFGANERASYAHESMHALQFARYDIRQLGFNEAVAKEDSERFLGIQALIEGEASLVGELWQAQTFKFDDHLDYWKENIQILSETYYLLEYPPILLSSFSFPYSQGKEFVQSLYQNGGWPAVDAAYANPPVSSEMIIHPEKYHAGDQPVLVQPPAFPPADSGPQWRMLGTNTWGEFGIRLILESVLVVPGINAAAAGWGGDRFTVWQQDTSGRWLAVWHTEWDNPADAGEFHTALTSYTRNRAGAEEAALDEQCWQGPDFAACVVSSGKSVWWFAAEDPDLARSAMEANLP